MSGARQAAFSFTLPRIQPGTRILDIGAGNSPLAGMLAREKRCSVLAVDINSKRLTWAWKDADERYEIKVSDLTRLSLPVGSFDAAVATYSLQHMINYEPLAWVLARQWLKKGGQLIAAARYRLNSPIYEGDRGDPLISQDEHTIAVLASYCGFAVVGIQPYWYNEQTFSEETIGSPRANCVLFELKAK